MRRVRALAAALLALVPASPSWAALARVELVPAAPSAAASAAPAALTPMAAPSALHSALASLLPVLTPALQMPSAAPAAPVALTAPAAARSAPPAPFTRDAQGRPAAVLTLKAAAARAEKTPDESGRFFDAAPAAPDFAALTPVRAPEAPAAWRPRTSLLKPVAAAVNAWNSSRHQKRLDYPRPEERVTTEEWNLRESLTAIHSALAEGRFQDAIHVVGAHFQTRGAAAWYAENPRYSAYREQAFAYMRSAETAVKAAYERADRRGADPALVAEAKAAARAGTATGHAWRETAIQAKDSGTCAQNAFYNAIAASVGFARPTSVFNFVAASRAALNRSAQLGRPASAADMAALSALLGVNFGRRDVGEGMGTDAMREWASVLGMKLAARGPPSGDAGWSALLAPGREALLSLRMFHHRFPHSADERDLRGHDWRVLHHEVYLLGAFDSPSLGRRLYLLQDSGSGATLMATAAELTALVSEVQVLETSRPVSVPSTDSSAGRPF
jgi:hypothetical protein